ncbi:hypothetical protein C5748_13865 [Phyllobacterium phragmitis]|uniref:Uncharacterized protein n=1 Tax=Phyllobacterium phragmitis TaxID=2670329 RepID=A0A2S9IQR2_9HYPH|nr:hypothetical protein [Phyllobacterium phragmitis]PRD42861.1 hypothetical protein C5748_13865 [Phyllobacterium phragmitis]
MSTSTEWNLGSSGVKQEARDLAIVSFPLIVLNSVRVPTPFTRQAMQKRARVPAHLQVKRAIRSSYLNSVCDFPNRLAARDWIN